MVIVEFYLKLLIAMAIFIPLEHLLPFNRDQKILREKWGLDATYALIASLMIIIGSTFVLLAGAKLVQAVVPQHFMTAIGEQPFILQLIEIIIIADIGYYWIHRLFHEVPALWRIHAVHHSIEELDWLAAHRVHPLDQIATRGVSMILPFALGFTPEALGAFVFIFGWHSYLKHSNAKIRFGPLRWVFATPTYHHWHHSKEKHALDMNYAGQLPILDILFGTAIMEEKHGPKIYGTDTEVPPNFMDQLFAPFRRQKPHEGVEIKRSDQGPV